MTLIETLGTEMLHNPFVIAIAAVGLLTTLTLVTSAMRAHLEGRAIAQLQLNCSRLKANRPATQDEIFEQLLQGLPLACLAAERVRVIQDSLRRGQSDLGIEAHADILADRAHLGLAFARYATSTLVLLGLCGAVYGLYTVVGELASPVDEIQQVIASMPDADTTKYSTKTDPLVQVFSKVTGRLKDSLEASRGAFGASLSGILATVALIFLTWGTAFAGEKTLLKLEKVTRDDLVPLVEVTSSGSALELLAADLKDGTTFLAGLGDALTEQTVRLNDVVGNMFVFVEKFHDGARSITSGSEKLGESQVRLSEIASRLVETAEQMKVTQEQSARSQADLGRLIQEVLTRVETQSNTLHQMQQRMDEGLQRSVTLVRELFEKRSSAIAELSAAALQTTLTEHAEIVRQTEDRQQRYVQALTEATITSTGHKTLLHDLEKTLATEREGFQISLDKALTSHRGHFEGLNRAITEERQSLRETRESNERLALAVRESVTELSSRLRNAPVGGGGGDAGSHRVPFDRLYAMAAVTTPAMIVGSLLLIDRLTGENLWVALLTGVAMAVTGVAAHLHATRG